MVAGSNFSPDASSNHETIAVPIHELDTIAPQVQELEQAAFASVDLEIGLDEPKQAVETLSHIDGLSVQVDFDLRAEGEHYATRSKICGIKSTASAGMMTTMPEGSLSWMKQLEQDCT